MNLFRKNTELVTLLKKAFLYKKKYLNTRMTPFFNRVQTSVPNLTPKFLNSYTLKWYEARRLRNHLGGQIWYRSLHPVKNDVIEIAIFKKKFKYIFILRRFCQKLKKNTKKTLILTEKRILRVSLYFSPNLFFF